MITVTVRWQGCVRGAITAALIFLLLFASRQKGDRIFQEKKKII
jgi:hypothetical protein